MKNKAVIPFLPVEQVWSDMMQSQSPDETACCNQRKVLRWTRLVLQKRDSVCNYWQANPAKERAFLCQINEVDHPNVWSEPVCSWDRVEDRLPGWMEKRAEESC